MRWTARFQWSKPKEIKTHVKSSGCLIVPHKNSSMGMPESFIVTTLKAEDWLLFKGFPTFLRKQTSLTIRWVDLFRPNFDLLLIILNDLIYIQGGMGIFHSTHGMCSTVV